MTGAMEMLTKGQCCCFAGHRQIDEIELPKLRARLLACVEQLIALGVDRFYCGGATGFDLLAGKVVLRLRRAYPQVQLVLALPYRNHEADWSAEQQAALRSLVRAADWVDYVSDAYAVGCMLKRSRHMVRRCGVCVAYLKRRHTLTGQMVRLARDGGLQVLNLARIHIRNDAG